MKSKLLCLVVGIIGCSLLSSCRATLEVKHDPLYLPSPHWSVIRAQLKKANNPKVDKIRIFVAVGDLTDCKEQGLDASPVPCREHIILYHETCIFSAPSSSGWCEYKVNIDTTKLITYHAQALNGDRVVLETGKVTYSGGGVPKNGVAHPVIWHVSQDDSFKNHIDLAFFPNDDYSTYDAFSEDLVKIVKDTFFSDRLIAKDYKMKYNSNSYYDDKPNLFNIWAGPFGAAAWDTCNWSFADPNVSAIRAIMDGSIILNTTLNQDCASLTPGNGESIVGGDVEETSGIPDSGRPFESNSLIHESGHFLYGANDEYYGGGFGGMGSGCPNVFTSEAICRIFAESEGFNTDDCTKICSPNDPTQCSSGLWRIDDGLKETMADPDDDASWRNSSGKCVVQKIQDCRAGSCF